MLTDLPLVYSERALPAGNAHPFSYPLFNDVRRTLVCRCYSSDWIDC